MSESVRPEDVTRRLIWAWVVVPLAATAIAAVMPAFCAVSYHMLLDFGAPPADGFAAVCGALVLARAGWVWGRAAGLGWRWWSLRPTPLDRNVRHSSGWGADGA